MAVSDRQTKVERYYAACQAERTKREAEAARYEWHRYARPGQAEPPGNWRYWLILAGRGFGKTRTGAEWIRQQAKTNRYTTIAGATADDTRVIMIEGESGILAVCPPKERPVYKPQRGELQWPNGAATLCLTAEKPDRFRGKQHEKLWADELAAWRYPESWDQALFGLRLGSNPRALVTTTPRPTKIIKGLLADPHTAVTRGSTYDNRANLAPEFFDAIIKRYEGTRLGRQEISAEVLDDNPYALFSRDNFDRNRLDTMASFDAVAIGVDPAVTNTEESAQTGIVAAARGTDGRGYVLGDYTLHGSPETWAKKVVRAYQDFNANVVVVEVNQGGSLVAAVLRHIAPNLPIVEVRATHGKQLRAEPIALLYEQNRISHVGFFPYLEDQCVEFVPGEGMLLDRMDAMVWAFTWLLPPVMPPADYKQAIIPARQNL